MLPAGSSQHQQPLSHPPDGHTPLKRCGAALAVAHSGQRPHNCAQMQSTGGLGAQTHLISPQTALHPHLKCVKRRASGPAVIHVGPTGGQGVGGSARVRRAGNSGAAHSKAAEAGLEGANSQPPPPDRGELGAEAVSLNIRAARRVRAATGSRGLSSHAITGASSRMAANKAAREGIFTVVARWLPAK
jgi:hypothetical protein